MFFLRGGPRNDSNEKQRALPFAFEGACITKSRNPRRPGNWFFASVGQTIGFRRLPCHRQTIKNDGLPHGATLLGVELQTGEVAYYANEPPRVRCGRCGASCSIGDDRPSGRQSQYYRWHHGGHPTRLERPPELYPLDR